MYCGLSLHEQSSCWTFELYRYLILACGRNIFAFVQALRGIRFYFKKILWGFSWGAVKSKGVSLFPSLCNLPHLPGAAGGEAETFPKEASLLCEGCNKA